MRYFLFSVVLIMCIASCSNSSETPGQDLGVSLELAKKRKANISFVAYDLFFKIPKSKESKILASEKIGVKIKTLNEALVLDFNVPDPGSVKSVMSNGSSVEYKFINGHIEIPIEALKKGFNEIAIDFIAGDQSLNRNEDFLYTLFVPDRASTAFPCFDQPDLKAKFNLILDIPAEWKALGNAKVKSENIVRDRRQITFEESDLMSTYLFSFVAGKFESISKEMDGITMTMLHRETDSTKVERNTDEIFKQHIDALRWLEDYTDIKYPFQKFDFAVIPAFQYGGMEHVGAIDYSASRLMLEESATLDDELAMSSLIAHETAHMWFGNLVTMDWFNDVWLKEVFANFMAAKITEPNFPEVNHDLNFLFSHYPQAYQVDRTEGANPIQQSLDNLKDAGSVYGNIIYHKAPIVMRQLELLMGEYAFREALREYLSNFSNSNASWDDLIEIMNSKTPVNLDKWSQIWIKEAGMPFVDIEFVDQADIRQFEIVQYDLTGNGRVWPQKFSLLYGYPVGDGNVSYQIDLSDDVFEIRKNTGTANPLFLQLNADAVGYGIFAHGLEYFRDDFLFNMGLIDVPSLRDEVQRGSAYLAMHEYLLHEGMNPLKYLRYLEEYIFVEENELILTYLLNNLETVYWRFLTLNQVKDISPEIESLLVQKLGLVSDEKIKHLIFKKYISIALSQGALTNLINFWSRDIQPQGITLSEEEEILIAYNIALKSNQVTGILQDQADRISNPDKKDEFEFVSQALSLESENRTKFFNSLLEVENRERESWVNKALFYLNHPLRTEYSVAFIAPALNEIEEVQRTGDIFFPTRWLNNSLWGHNSDEAVSVIRNFLASNPNLNEKLRQKVLQAADMTFRANRDISQYGTQPIQ